jgi:hypothetical protein
MAKPTTIDDASQPVGVIADILPQLDDTIAGADAASNVPEAGVVMKSGRRYRITVEPPAAG